MYLPEGISHNFISNHAVLGRQLESVRKILDINLTYAVKFQVKKDRYEFL